ncbi:MAG: AraC family transcriptional regulator CmrA, partial [Pseudomonas stutzeri]|nr:AraC family transcriptional regulator CmrA [Stutzerimonas stutzeri]
MNQLDLHSAEETIAQRAALARLIDGLVRDDGMHPTAIDDLFLIRCSAPSELVHGLHKPALCIIVQGSKEVRLGDELYTYDALHYLVVSVTVPVAGRVLEASSGEPYLCIRLDIDPAMVATLVAESAPLSQPVEGAARGVYLDRI